MNHLLLWISIFVLSQQHGPTLVHSFSANNIPSSSLSNDGIRSSSSNINDDETNDIQVAVIVPGFLTGADDFKSICRSMTECGIPTMAVPMSSWHWIPCLGGRSARPILERLDFTVQHLAANGGDINNVPAIRYTWLDCWNDFWTNPRGVLKVGGSDEVVDYPTNIQPQGTYDMPTVKRKKKIVLIGHSAGGWISMVYMSNREYGGKAYCGGEHVHTFVTLGSPLASAPGPTFSGIRWCNEATTAVIPDSVRALAIGGIGYLGTNSFTKSAYAFCCPDGTDGSEYDGDGLTPIFSSLALPAEKWTLPGIAHVAWSDLWGANFVASELEEDYRLNQRSWYGSPDVVDRLVKWIRRN